MKSTSIIVVVLCTVCAIVAGCSADESVGDLGPSRIAFELTTPGSLPAADFYGIAGVEAVNQKVPAGDSLIEIVSQRLYGEFYTTGGTPLPATVAINGVTLLRNLDTDTLRLGGVITGVDFSGIHTWRLTDSGGAPQSIQVGPVPLIDSVAPFPTAATTIRGDTALRVTWEPSGDVSTRMMLQWTPKSGKNPYMQFMNDGSGSFVVPTEVMKTLVGPGTVVLVRYRYIQGQFRGKNVVLVRTAEREYNVTVLQ
jgi:hypothetical protein